MKVIEHLEKAKSTLFSLEILPPLKGQNIQTIFDAIDPLMEFKPPFVDVTYHREEYILKPRKTGGYDRIATRKRPGTVGICAAILNRYHIDPVPHIICGGFTREETENALIDLNFLGIDNALLIRGDSIANEKTFVPEPGGNNYAIDLVAQVVNMNQGLYLDETLQNAHPTDFCIGISGYPEKHFEAPNLKSDLKYLKQKIDMGAEYIVTQMFFDNQKYFDFVKVCREDGITVPIIPGLKPITTLKQMKVLPSIFHIDLPDTLVESLEQCKDNDAAREVGIEWCIQQSKELMEFGVPVLHYYTMSKSEHVLRIAKALF